MAGSHAPNALRPTGRLLLPSREEKAVASNTSVLRGATVRRMRCPKVRCCHRCVRLRHLFSSLPPALVCMFARLSENSTKPISFISFRHFSFAQYFYRIPVPFFLTSRRFLNFPPIRHTQLLNFVCMFTMHYLFWTRSLSHLDSFDGGGGGPQIGAVQPAGGRRLAQAPPNMNKARHPRSVSFTEQ